MLTTHLANHLTNSVTTGILNKFPLKLLQMRKQTVKNSIVSDISWLSLIKNIELQIKHASVSVIQSDYSIQQMFYCCVSDKWLHEKLQFLQVQALLFSIYYH